MFKVMVCLECWPNTRMALQELTLQSGLIRMLSLHGFGIYMKNNHDIPGISFHLWPWRNAWLKWQQIRHQSRFAVPYKWCLASVLVSPCILKSESPRRLSFLWDKLNCKLTPSCFTHHQLITFKWWPRNVWQYGKDVYKFVFYIVYNSKSL